jgi:hypothetical protein
LASLLDEAPEIARAGVTVRARVPEHRHVHRGLLQKRRELDQLKRQEFTKSLRSALG